MTQEDKNLVLKDLSMRLPYGVMCDRLGQPRKLLSVTPHKAYPLEFDHGEYMPNDYKVEDVKPYLRSMSNITDDEKDLLDIASAFLRGAIDTKSLLAVARASSALTWICYELHLDINGLIPKGLALEAPEGMYE